MARGLYHVCLKRDAHEEVESGVQTGFILKDDYDTGNIKITLQPEDGGAEHIYEHIKAAELWGWTPIIAHETPLEEIEEEPF